jgi:hypothetical protein
LFYGLIAAASGAMAWKIAIGSSRQPLLWALSWLVVSGGVMCGLPLFKPWARRLAIFGSAVLMALTLSVAAACIMASRPLAALIITLGAGLHVLTIRYLRRPAVRRWFDEGIAVSNKQ